MQNGRERVCLLITFMFVEIIWFNNAKKAMDNIMPIENRVVSMINDELENASSSLSLIDVPLKLKGEILINQRYKNSKNTVKEMKIFFNITRKQKGRRG
ncbi:hypothetical protein [Pseudoalteromonas sp. A601]|uniref:hypothetical protein n=1 Tax=Pseudoalteromonas sp. A601 TaxID=1967839 RepID=UPI00159386AB|nr:hypothetical protein [Pseudoalteromonas sp. A601]